MRCFYSGRPNNLEGPSRMSASESNRYDIMMTAVFLMYFSSGSTIAAAKIGVTNGMAYTKPGEEEKGR